MSATWDSKGVKATPVSADEVLIIDTEDGRNQKRATITSLPIFWSRNAGSGFLFPTTLTDKIGIGINAPLGTVHIRTTSAGVEIPDADADDLIIENAGNVGYTIAPSVIIADPEAVVTATGTVIIIDGINKIFSLSGGSGYSSVPTVTFDNPGTGSDVTLAFATVVGGVVTAITITNKGSGYGTVTPGITFSGGSPSVAATAVSGPPGFVSSITPDLVGSGYHSASPPSVTIADSTLTNGTTATATPVFVNTEITSYIITDAGSGYGITAPTVTVDAPPAAVTGLATAQIGSGKVTGITITNTPSGYKIPLPVVTITGGDGDGAGVDQITLGISTSTISSITVTKGGAGITVFSPIDNVSVIDFSHPGFPRHGSLRFNHDTEAFQLLNNQRQTIIADGSSNVGITSQTGTLTEKFTVDSDVANEPSIIMMRDTFDRLRMGYDGGAVFSTTETAAQVVVQSGTGDLHLASRGDFNSNIRFYTSSGANLLESMRIDIFGNIGIKTFGSAANETLYTVGTVGGAITTASIAGWNITPNTPAGCVTFGTLFPTNLCFKTQNVERMRILTTGDVGIGISPTVRLDVFTTATDVARFDTSNSAGRITLDSGSNTGIIYQTSGVDRWLTLAFDISGGTNIDFEILNSQLSTFPFSIVGDNDNVGISTPTGANSKLEVNGSFAVKRVATAVSVNTVDEVIIGVTDTSVTRTITIQTADIVVGRLFIIKDESGAAGTNNITIATQGAETIDGAASVAITANFGAARLYSDGSNLFLW